MALQVSQLLDDVFYEAYSHFLRHNVGAFFFSLPVQLKQLLGEDQMDRLLKHLGCVHHRNAARGVGCAGLMQPISVSANSNTSNHSDLAQLHPQLTRAPFSHCLVHYPAVSYNGTLSSAHSTLCALRD